MLPLDAKFRRRFLNRMRNLDHLPDPERQSLERITRILLAEFDEAIRGKQAGHRKAGRVLKLIARGPTAPPAADGIDIVAIVNHRELADKERHWRLALAACERIET